MKQAAWDCIRICFWLCVAFLLTWWLTDDAAANGREECVSRDAMVAQVLEVNEQAWLAGEFDDERVQGLVAALTHESRPVPEADQLLVFRSHTTPIVFLVAFHRGCFVGQKKTGPNTFLRAVRKVYGRPG